MSKKHVQTRAAKAVRRKKMLAERRKTALAGTQMSLAAQVRRIAVAPIHSCLIGEALFDDGLGYLVLARKAADGTIAMATFLLDVYCVGVKDVILRLGGTTEIELFLDRLGDAQPMVAIEPSRARKLLRDLVAWSRSIGLAPHPDYVAAEPPSPSVRRSASIRFRVRAGVSLGDGGFDYTPEVDHDVDVFGDDATDPGDDFDAETGDAIESLTGMQYDPEVVPDPAIWQELDEDERIMLVKAYHRRTGVELPNTTVHAIVHVVIENQAAVGDELPVRRAIERLMGEGLDRHEAVHAVASVLAAHMNDTVKAGTADNAAYNAAVERLTAESWRAEFGPETEDDRD